MCGQSKTGWKIPVIRTGHPLVLIGALDAGDQRARWPSGEPSFEAQEWRGRDARAKAGSDL